MLLYYNHMVEGTEIKERETYVGGTCRSTSFHGYIGLLFGIDIGAVNAWFNG